MAPAIAVAVATTLCAWSDRNGVTAQRVEPTSAVTARARVAAYPVELPTTG
ncbi:hypothetical protein ABH940_001667 [Streptacidiphilus sp. BW17]|uniref:hypothetical protein n=1 Tax=Streptacidiphilus sp. BW17 TaxID=3156274 RepID=UPI0035187AFA